MSEPRTCTQCGKPSEYFQGEECILCWGDRFAREGPTPADVAASAASIVLPGSKAALEQDLRVCRKQLAELQQERDGCRAMVEQFIRMVHNEPDLPMPHERHKDLLDGIETAFADFRDRTAEAEAALPLLREEVRAWRERHDWAVNVKPGESPEADSTMLRTIDRVLAARAATDAANALEEP